MVPSVRCSRGGAPRVLDGASCRLSPHDTAQMQLRGGRSSSSAVAAGAAAAPALAPATSGAAAAGPGVSTSSAAAASGVGAAFCAGAGACTGASAGRGEASATKRARCRKCRGSWAVPPSESRPTCASSSSATCVTERTGVGTPAIIRASSAWLVVLRSATSRSRSVEAARAASGCVRRKVSAMLSTPRFRTACITVRPHSGQRPERWRQARKQPKSKMWPHGTVVTHLWMGFSMHSLQRRSAAICRPRPLFGRACGAAAISTKPTRACWPTRAEGNTKMRSPGASGKHRSLPTS
mmetsp:Transcript_96848/g.269342  ORF Transcript_96848/g.269342 Transcript_96848/m.269342 type:complete len:295 (+) Transcript_96848:158-1042(+)